MAVSIWAQRQEPHSLRGTLDALSMLLRSMPLYAFARGSALTGAAITNKPTILRTAFYFTQLGRLETGQHPFCFWS